MTIKYNELIAVSDIINGLMDKNMPIVIGHKIQRNFKKIKEALDEFEQSRMKLVDKYANKDENGKPIIVGNRFDIPDKSLFDDEYNELLNAEIDIPFDTISFTAVSDMEASGKYDSLTPREQAALDFMIEEEVE